MSRITVSELAGITASLGQLSIPSGHEFLVNGKLEIDRTDYVQLPQGTTAQRPSSPNPGYIRWNTTESQVEVWDGHIWFAVGAALGSQSNPASSAWQILNVDANTPDGVYWFDHGTGSGAYQAYADMTNGGYILVGKISDTPADTTNPWSYNGARWSQTTTTNESDCTNTTAGDALNRAYYEYTLAEGFRFSMGTATNQISVERTNVTAKDAFTGTQYNVSTLGRSNFLTWIANAGTPASNWDNQPNCNRIGFNRTDSSNSAMRFGITMNNENECNSNDSAIGFGCYTNNQSSSGDRNCAAGGFRWSSTVRYPYDGWIWVK